MEEFIKKLEIPVILSSIVLLISIGIIWSYVDGQKDGHRKEIILQDYKDKYQYYTYEQKERFFFDVGTNPEEINWGSYFNITLNDGTQVKDEYIVVKYHPTTFSSSGLKPIQVYFKESNMPSLLIKEFYILVFDDGPIIYGADPVILDKGIDFNQENIPNYGRGEHPTPGTILQRIDHGIYSLPLDQPLYTLHGIGAIDKEDLDITDQLQIIGDINMDVLGLQKITYQVSDSDGNITIVEQPIYVTTEIFFYGFNDYQSTIKIKKGINPDTYEWEKQVHLLYKDDLNSKPLPLPIELLSIDYSMVNFNKKGTYPILVSYRIYNYQDGYIGNQLELKVKIID